MNDYLHEAFGQMEAAGENEAAGRPNLAIASREWAVAYALLSIAESLDRLAAAVVPDSAEGYPPALNVMDTTH